VLAEALKEKDNDVRIKAAGLLGEIGPAAKAAVPALREMLRDRDPAVHDAAAEGLKKIDPAAAPSPPAE
jgi:HEAT repeat protein